MSDVLRTDSETRLRRSLSLLSVTMLGAGAMIGAGIFVLVGIAAGLAGPSLLLVFVLNAGFAVTVGACYAELCAAIRGRVELTSGWGPRSAAARGSWPAG